MVSFRGYAMCSKSDMIFSTLFFLCQKSNLRGQMYLLGSSSCVETKLILVRECKSLKEQDGLQKETEVLWWGETLSVATQKTYCWQPWNCCNINRHQRFKHMGLKGVTILTMRKSSRKINECGLTLLYRQDLEKTSYNKQNHLHNKEELVSVTHLQICKSPLLTWVKKMFLRIMILRNDRNVCY